MIRKGCALLLIFLQLCGPALASVLTVEEVSVVGAAADDYYSAARPRLKVLTSDKVGLVLVNPAQLSATASLSGLTAGALGIAGIGYYARTGKDPVYAAASAVASGADALFVPAYQAFKANFVSPETFPASAAQYVGVEGAVGATLQNIVDHVKRSASGAYTSLKNLIEANSLPVAVNPSDFFVGVVLELTDGTFFEITQAPYAANYTTLTYFNNNGSTYPKSVYSTLIYATPSQAVFLDLNDTSVNSYGATTYRVWIAKGRLETKEPTYKPSPGVSYPGLADGLVSPTPEVASDLQQVIKDLPAAQKITSSDPAPAQVPAANPQTITNNQIQNFFTTNTTNLYNNYNDIVNNSASTSTEIEQAKVAAQTAAQQENEVKEDIKEPEPNYPVPTSWYTPACDLSDGLSSCINYQQVLNASAAFQETALYQLPNLLLDCLGYVEGSGCEYPPKITVDLSSRFITDPMVLDMAPFDSVVKVMKFFFAILCIIGTGKAVMVLFS